MTAGLTAAGPGNEARYPARARDEANYVWRVIGVKIRTLNAINSVCPFDRLDPVGDIKPGESIYRLENDVNR